MLLTAGLLEPCSITFDILDAVSILDAVYVLHRRHGWRPSPSQNHRSDRAAETLRSFQSNFLRAESDAPHFRQCGLEQGKSCGRKWLLCVSLTVPAPLERAVITGVLPACFDGGSQGLSLRLHAGRSWRMAVF